VSEKKCFERERNPIGMKRLIFEKRYEYYLKLWPVYKN
jgi:hypothetical protein